MPTKKTAPNNPPHDTAKAALLESQIITLADDGGIVWRVGHLEHLAHLYAADPTQTTRDYANDLDVARTYSAAAFDALVKAITG